MRIDDFPAGHAMHTSSFEAPVTLEYRPPPHAVQSHMLSSGPCPYAPASHSSHCRWGGWVIEL